MKEIKSLRKSNEKHFLNKDGTITAYLYDRDIHYLKNNEYVEIDNKLVDGGNYLVNKDNAFHTFFKKDKRSNLIVDVEKDNHYLKIYLNKKKSSKLNILNKDNGVSFKDILDDIDMDYNVISTKLKESIILKNKNNIPESLTFKIETDLILRINNRKIEAKDLNNNIIFIVDAPYMWDNNKNYNYDITYSLIKKDEYYLLNLNLDKEWLNNAEFPVIIDPTLEAKDIQIFDAYIYSWDNPGYIYDNQFLKVGMEVDSPTRTYSSLMKFNLPKLGTGCEVIDAKVNLYSHPSDTSSNEKNNIIYVYSMEKDWNENEVIYNDLYLNIGEIVDYFTPIRSKLENNILNLNLNSFNVTNLMKKWYAGKPNYGIMLKADKYTGCPEYTFCSKEYSTPDGKNPKPFIEVTYRNLNGLEDYMSYQTQEYTNGKSYVNNLTGNLTTVFNLNETIGGKYPVNLSMVYNTNDAVLDMDLGYGLGYRFNLHETIKEDIINNNKYLEYLDADGTLHYFVKDYDSNGNVIENKYVDEDGLRLEAFKDDNKYIVKDKDANQYIFELDAGIYYLKELINTIGNKVIISYDINKRINKIVDGNNKEINISYNNDKIMVSTDNKTTTINYLDNKIINIVYNNGIINFTYNDYGLIDKITDINGLSNKFDYIDINPYKVKKVTEYGIDNEIGKYLEFEYKSLATKVKNNKELYSNYLFNTRGCVINVNNLDDKLDFKNSYGSGATYVDNTTDNEINKAINSIITKTSPVKFTKNLIINDSFEKEIFNNNYETTEDEARTGNKSLKIKNTYFWANFVEPGRQYTLCGYFKNDKPISIQVTTPGAHRPNWLILDDIPINSEFTKYSFDFELPEYSRLLEIEITSNSDLTFLDDLQLEEKVSSNFDIMTNGNFEDDLMGWILNSEEQDKIVEVGNGNRAFKFNLKPGVIKSISNITNIDGCAHASEDGIGDVYYLSFWYKNTGVDKKTSLLGNKSGLGVEIEFLYDANNCNSDKMWFDLNAGNDDWQYFSRPFFSKPECNYTGIKTTIFGADNVNELYISNISLSKDLDLKYNLNNADTGNLDAIKNKDSSKIEFKYDKNNQLTSMFNPKGNNFKFEYDNQIQDRVLKGISPSGISNEIKYDSFGNPIKTLINNVNPDNEIVSGKYYHIRLKGTNKYLDCDFLTKQINLKEDDCSHDAFLATDIGLKYHFKISKYSLVGDYLSVRLNTDPETNGYAVFRVIKNNDGSYKLRSYLTDAYLCNNNGVLSLSNENTKEEDMCFYFEDVDTPLFIESKAEYTEDGKFITKTIDSLGKKTLYDINPLNGLTNSITDANEQVTTYTYNDKEQITKVEKNNKEVNYTYNNQDLLSNITSGNKDYKFNYDNFLNTKDIKINNQTLVTNEYEPNNGNLIKTTYGNGSWVTYNYDDLNRVSSVVVDGKIYNNKYNNLGEISKITTDNEEYTYLYDLSGRIYKYLKNNYVDNKEFSIKYEYDLNNNITYKNYYYDYNSESLNFDYNSDDAITKVTFNNNNLNYKYDYLGRLVSKDINDNLKQEYKYISNGNKTSNTINEVKIGNDVYNYKYDNLYNITDMYLNKELINHYEYDNFNELIKEDSYILNKTTEYTYDTEGNILNRKEYELNTNNLIYTDIYEYNNSNWEDQLTKFNNETITYDEIGNPTSIGTKELVWINGRQLDTYKDGELEIKYSYDKNGIRNSKIINSVETKYFTENNKIIFEESNNNMIYYIRDEEGSLIGLKYNNSIYYYIKNLQEDIIGITDSNYNEICRYEYDSFGKIITIKDNNGNIIEDESHIGIINPHRYRSYYYDKEIELYYLNSRYYNPEWGRFINADGIINSNKDILGCNLYAYVDNNFINSLDISGNFKSKFFDKMLDLSKKVFDTIKEVCSEVVSKKITATRPKRTPTKVNLGIGSVEYGAEEVCTIGESKPITFYNDLATLDSGVEFNYSNFNLNLNNGKWNKSVGIGTDIAVLSIGVNLMTGNLYGRGEIHHESKTENCLINEYIQLEVYPYSLVPVLIPIYIPQFSLFPIYQLSY